MLIIHCFQHYGAISTGAASNDAASTRAVSRFEKYTLCNIHILLHGLISKAFTLFCREFENVVIHAFLVLIFWAKNAAGATVCAFCNYDECTGRNNSIGINSKPIMEGHCKYLNEIVQPRQRDASFKKDKPAGCSSKARRTHPADGGILQGLPGPSLMFCVCIFRTAVIRRR